MRLLIFGAGGFIGSHLVKEAGGRGDEVIALSRSGFVRDFSGAIIKWEFAQPLPEAVLQPADCAIHLAHDFYGAEGAEKTVNSNT